MKRIGFLVLGTLALASQTAAAEGLSGGVMLMPMPLGTLEVSGGGVSDSTDTEMAFGIGAFLDKAITPNVSIGFMPQYTLNVKAEDAEKSAKELDLLLRLRASFPASDTAQVFGYLAPGYSFLFMPDKPEGQDNPAGLVVQAAAGASFTVSGNVFASAQLGYQWGFQGVEINGVDFDLTTNFLHVGAAIGSTF